MMHRRLTLFLVMGVWWPPSPSLALPTNNNNKPQRPLPPPQSLSWCSEEVLPPPYLNVHLVPHSHDDIGWLKTVDQYYYGDRNDIQLASVQYTLDSVVSELSRSPSRRFIYVEVGFFYRWWEEQDTPTRALVSRLVASGQLEFINGGWVMNDEATTHYSAIIDQMTLGLRWLNATFGVTGVTVGWQIDPFGHSREMASLFAQMGFDAVFFGRLDFQDKRQRQRLQQMEFLWDASPNDLKSSSRLFGGALKNGYNPPSGFCFDIFCTDSPINDNPRLEDFNVDSRVEEFVAAATDWARPFTTNHIQMTMGSDFQYLAAHTWYKNLDKLIKYVNARQNGTTTTAKLNLLYSTPSCYLQSVNSAAAAAGNTSPFNVKSDDFFPYASDPHAFWTGYFTSRPTLKYFAHSANNLLQVAKQVLTSAIFYRGQGQRQREDLLLADLFVLQEAVAVLQHHDAVSGTAKQHVTDDYAKRLHKGVSAATSAISRAINDLDGVPAGVPLSTCPLLNVSSCPPTETADPFYVRAYNPLARPLPHHLIRVPVVVQDDSLWTVTDLSTGDLLPVQLVPVSEGILRVPGRSSPANFELVFAPNALEPLAFNNFRVQRGTTATKTPPQQSQATPIRDSTSSGTDTDTDDFWILNKENVGLELSGVTGEVKSLRVNGTTLKLSQGLFYYPSMGGNNSEFAFRASGAYIFRPNSSEPTPLGPPARYAVYSGPLVTEVHQEWDNNNGGGGGGSGGGWISQVIRLEERAHSVQFLWTVGPIPVGDGVGKEVVVRWSSPDLATEGVWYTDANGRELIRRQRNKRPTWDYKVTEGVAGNYYPVTSRLLLRDLSRELQLAVLNDRAQGGTSMSDGEAELMVHRRILHDDAFGVGEPLNEVAFHSGLVATGTFHLLLTSTSNDNNDGLPPAWTHRLLGEELFMKPALFFQPATAAENNDVINNRDDGRWRWSNNKLTLTTSLPGVSALATSGVLPPRVRVLTVEPLEDSSSTFLLRLEHFFQAEDYDGDQQDPICVIDRAALLRALGAERIRETRLAANVFSDEATPRLNWNTNQQQEKGEEPTPDLDGPIISLPPMAIKTFIVFK